LQFEHNILKKANELVKKQWASTAADEPGEDDAGDALNVDTPAERFHQLVASTG